MSGDLSKLSDDRLRAMLYQSRQMLSSLSESLEARPDMQNAIRRLMSPNDMLETFSELAVKNLTRLALQRWRRCRVFHGSLQNIEKWLALFV